MLQLQFYTACLYEFGVGCNALLLLVFLTALPFNLKLQINEILFLFVATTFIAY